MDCAQDILYVDPHDRNSCHNNQVEIRLGVANVRSGNKNVAVAVAVAAEAAGDKQ